MLKLINKILVPLLAIVIVAPPVEVSAQVMNQPELVISEVKVRYDSNSGSDFDEYIELHNVSSAPVSLAGYLLEYFNATNSSPTQQPTQKPISDKVLGIDSQLVLAKQPYQVPDSILSPFSSLSDGGGRLRLVTIEGEVVDEIVWTNSQAAQDLSATPPILYQCNTSTILCNGNKIQSFSRLINEEGSYVQEGQTWHLAPAQPSSSQLNDPVAEPEDDPQNEEPGKGDGEEPEATTCQGIVISEVQPNPDGSDTGKEFIELHNPTAASISLENCALQISGSSKTYAFGPVEMGPATYIAFYDNVTQLTLPNAAGGTVWLLDSTDEVHEVVYPGEIDDDASWANIGGIFGITYTLTPNALNISTPLKPCEPGEVRDAAGKCQLPATQAISTLVHCRVGQERSPETNRCRNMTTVTTSTLSACKAGQERNPETNRCRNVLAASTLAPCGDDEERNPETNRCRKVADTVDGKLASVKDVKAPINASSPTWWLAGVAILLAIGYAIYEWRQEVFAPLSRLFIKR